jgi:hypothetical protein
MWWQPGDVLALDFGNNRYMHDGATVSLATVLSASRTSPATWFTAAGVLQSFGPNVPAITDRGLYAGGQRVNKCTNDNANPVDLTNLTLTNSTGGAPEPGVTLTVVDDAGELAAAGLSGVCTSGKVYKLDNSTSGGTSHRATFGGTPGNTNLHALSCYMRGSGSAQLRFQGSTSSTGMGTQPLTSGYQRWVATGVPNATTFPMYVLALPGSVVYFILNQLEEGSFVSPPIVTAGSAATRLADSLTIPDFAAKAAAFGFEDGFAGEAVIDLTRLGDPSTRHIWAFGSSGNDVIDLYIVTANEFRLRRNKSGVGSWSAAYAIAEAAIHEVAFAVSPAALSLSVNGDAVAPVAHSGGMPAFDLAFAGSNITGANALGGPLRELRLRGVAA